MKKTIVAAAALAASFLAPVAASADDAIQVGRLSCLVEPGHGLIVFSEKDLSCTFHADGGAHSSFSGTIKKFGLDVGVTERTHIEWIVFTAGHDNFAHSALAGKYVGASAEASFGVGGGANWLIGGDRDSFMLQPWSGQAQVGFNVAAGFTGLELH